MNTFLKYLKGVVGGGGAVFIPPIVGWLVTFTHAPDNVQSALAGLIVFAIVGGGVAAVPNITRQGPTP